MGMNFQVFSVKDPTCLVRVPGVERERSLAAMNQANRKIKAVNQNIIMPKSPLRITVPPSPDKLIELAEAILLKHTDAGVNSPLKSLKISDFQARTAEAKTNNKLSKELYRKAERATEDRDVALGHDGTLQANTVRFFVTSARDLLSGIYKGNEQALGDWGFEVDTSPRPAKAKKKTG